MNVRYVQSHKEAGVLSKGNYVQRSHDNSEGVIPPKPYRQYSKLFP